MDYDFRSLSDYDFEQLVCDLLSVQLGQRVESFRRGRDLGIDLRYTTAGGGKTVVQCKHYAKTPFSGLCAAMEKEYEKIQRLSPERYILVTSRFLTPMEKDRLLEILAPFCRSAEDILGGDELNSLLRQYPAVEQAHYKLWLTSSAVLEKILHSGIYQQSVVMGEEIQRKLQLYVQSKKAYDKAREMLKEYNCCIISGIPGIGKTTLAEILSIYYLDQDYQIIKVRSDIQEALQAYHPDRKQAFIYDDFLGSTGLEMKENKNEGKDLLAFLDFISRQKGKKVILTTREYILNQARQSSEEFARENFDYKKCVISLEDYTREDRARILYNHLFFYGVDRRDVQDLLAENRVIELIDHPNYSPRLIETVIKLWHTAEGDSFYQFFANILDRPSKLWEHAFCRKISPAARDLLLLLCPVRDTISVPELKIRYEVYHREKCRLQNRPLNVTDLNDALRETEGTFIWIDREDVSYHNPSVRDFIHGYIRENEIEFKILCESAVDLEFCILLAYLDQDLCRGIPEEFAAALWRTASKDDQFRLAEQISDLERANMHLRMEEVRQVIQRMLELFSEKLEKACEVMSEDNWDKGVSPHSLREILEELSVSECGPELAGRLFDTFFRYSLAWFEYSCIYLLDDFRVFPALHSRYPFFVARDRFQSVYEAMEDYRNEVAWNVIGDMDYEGECEAYQEELEELEDLFGVDLSDLMSEAEERIFELREAEESGEDHDWADSFALAKKLNDREILNMFQGLLDQKSPASGGETAVQLAAPEREGPVDTGRGAQ